MAATYQDNFDYSEAIANETDSKKRAELLEKRQNKIDAEGLAGKVASNDVVATWSGSNRPYSLGTGRSGAFAATGPVSQIYDAAEKARLQAFEQARARIASNLDHNLRQIDSDYTASRRQIDLNARRSVQGNEEKLAALGLNMGGRYAAATSGTAETSRIALQSRYQSDLNALESTRIEARAAAHNDAEDREAALWGNYYAGESSAKLSQAQAALQQYNAARDYSLSVAGLTGFLDGTQTLAYRKYQSDVASNQYEQALQRWKNYGYVLASDASVLGVPAGTATSDERYNNAYLAYQRWKATL